MWALIEDGQIVREFVGRENFRLDNINYSLATFGDPDKLKSLGILPIVIRHVDSPEDPGMYLPVRVDTVGVDSVDRELTWVARDSAGIAIVAAPLLAITRSRLLNDARAVIEHKANQDFAVTSDTVPPQFQIDTQSVLDTALVDVDAALVDVDYPATLKAIVDAVVWPGPTGEGVE